MFKHGDFSVVIENQMIILRVSGSHNEYDTLAVTQCLREEILKLQGKPFVELIDGRELQGTTPEGFKVLEEYERWLLTQNLIAKAFVYQNQIIPEIADKRIPSIKRPNAKSFTDIDVAKTWLLSKLKEHDIE